MFSSCMALHLLCLRYIMKRFALSYQHNSLPSSSGNGWIHQFQARMHNQVPGVILPFTKCGGFRENLMQVKDFALSYNAKYNPDSRRMFHMLRRLVGLANLLSGDKQSGLYSKR